MVTKNALVRLALCSFLWGCGDTGSPTVPAISGSFALVRVNGRALPDTETIAASLDPRQPPCALLRTGGSLSLEPTSGKFLISVNARNACTGFEWVILTEEGTYTQNGPALSMQEPFPAHVATFSGLIGPDSIRINGVYHDYTFAR